MFVAILLGLPLLIAAVPNHSLELFEAFYRAGSLVFGGGHVVLPLLQASVVPPGWVSNDAFLAGYGAAQAVPGPLFTFSAYLGAVMGPQPNGWLGATLCLVAMFLPSFFLTIGALPFWDELRRRPAAQSALRGVNAAVVGLLLAALYNPVWTSGISSGADFALAIAAFLLLFMWQVSPWLVVVLSAFGGAAIAHCALRAHASENRFHRDAQNSTSNSPPRPARPWPRRSIPASAAAPSSPCNRRRNRNRA